MMTKFFALLLLVSLAATAKYELESRVVPSDHAPYRQEWIKDIHQGPEVWSIHNWNSFTSMMLGKGVSSADLEKIKASYQPQIANEPSAEAAGVFGLYGKPSKHISGHVIADEALINSLSPETLRAVHGYTVESGYFIRVLSPNFYGDIRPGLAGIDASEADVAALEKLMFKGLYNTAIPATKAIWQQLPYKLRARLVDHMLPPTKVLNVTLKFKEDQDIEDIAKDFAMGRDPELLKRFLRKKLKDQSNGSVEIPLETILTPFIRDSINTYHLVGGANCSNASCAANSGKHYTQTYQPFEAFLNDLNTYFRPLGDGEQRHAGDFMVFYESDLRTPLHAAVVIADDIVFTKNGQTRASPYQFQNVRDLPESYGKEIRFFRRTQPYQMQSTPSIRKPVRMLKSRNTCVDFY